MQQPGPPSLPPGYEIKKKGHFWRNAGIGCGGLIVLIIAGSIAAANGASKSPTTSAPAVFATAPASNAPKASTAPKTAGTVLLDKTGSGINQTPKFTASGDWEIHWSYDCGADKGNFQIFVYSGDGSLAGVAANALDVKGSDVSYQHRGGTYYLQMNSGCNWHVTVMG
jgi:hypothetical protein